MSNVRFRPFSKRFDEALRSSKLRPSIPRRLRTRLWLIMSEHNPTYDYNPVPGDNWTEKTTMLHDLPAQLGKLYGVKKLEAFVGEQRREVNLEGFVMGAYPAQVFDVVEMFAQGPLDRLADFQTEVTQAFEDENSPWLLCNGSFFQLDSQFVEVHVLQRAHELLVAARFDGALQEFVEARNDLVAGDFKGAIHNAGKAFESALKAIENRHDGNAKSLIDDLKDTRIYEGFPASLISGFGDQVLMSLPTIRNRAGGHGQGGAVIEVPRSLAELSVHLAAVFIVFLVKRHLEITGNDTGSRDSQSEPPGATSTPI